MTLPQSRAREVLSLDWLADVPGAVKLGDQSWCVPAHKVNGRMVARVRLQNVIRQDRPRPAFTPEQLASVFVSRWLARDIANEFIRYLRPNALMSYLRSRR